MDVQITPDPTDAEREAIVRALELEAETVDDPSPWRRRGLRPDDDDQATAPRRQSRGAVRA